MPEPFRRRLGRARWDGLPSPGFQRASGRVRGKPRGFGRWLPQRVVTSSRSPESRDSRRWRRVFGSWELCISGSSVPQVSRAADLQTFVTTGLQSRRSADLQWHRSPEPEICRPSEPPISRAADLQTFGTTGPQSRRSADLRNHASRTFRRFPAIGFPQGGPASAMGISAAVRAQRTGTTAARRRKVHAD